MAARENGRIAWGLVAILAVAVAVLAVWVWPSSRGDVGDSGPAQVDTTGPIGRIGQTTAGSNTGGATDPIEAPGTGRYAGITGTGSITGPIGGLEAARGADGGTPGGPTGGVTGGGGSG